MKDHTDEFIKFEVMDRAQTLATMLDQLLTGHTGLKNGDLQVLHDAAEEALANLYIEAGLISMGSDDGGEP